MNKTLKSRIARGFTLVEIMVVVAIVGFLAAVAITNFVRARLNANEKVIRSDLRAFSTSNESYRALQNPPTYAPDVQTLIDQQYLDSTWTNPAQKHGFNLVYKVNADRTAYSLEADVLEANVTGLNYYCVDSTGNIVFSDTAGLGTATGCVGGEYAQG